MCIFSHCSLSVKNSQHLKSLLLQVPGQGPTSYLDAAQREKALQQMQQMSSAQIVSATAHMQPRMGPPVTYGGFWQHPGALGGNNCQPINGKVEGTMF